MVVLADMIPSDFSFAGSHRLNADGGFGALGKVEEPGNDIASSG